ncbi:hypothetical protein sscle_11g081530 [Sclerotinia sclerotiorum 1980 UF-70]|uniref:Uncharacterized protein n=1 Tax=Sclerotinia sclerotiorum (strain ATCC 18683 / 1980 / Ss-1) TaxID=665079 RepID=A0A1D9QFJ2_SCLS1|nr:hypothetical protein sscle_11g081530 [Sclerotinia sclerotiorum 1980 UF-70]
MLVRLKLSSNGAECYTRAIKLIGNVQAQHIDPFGSTISLTLPDFKKLDTPDCVARILEYTISNKLRDRSIVGRIVKVYNENRELQELKLLDFLQIWSSFLTNEVSNLSRRPSFSPSLSPSLSPLLPPSRPPSLEPSLPPPSQLGLGKKATHYAKVNLPVPQTYTNDDNKAFSHRYQVFYGSDLKLIPPHYYKGAGLWFGLDIWLGVGYSYSRLIVVVPPEIQILINIQPLKGYFGTDITLDRCAFLTVCNMELEKHKNTIKGQLLVNKIQETISSFADDVKELEEQVTSTDLNLINIVSFFNKNVVYSESFNCNVRAAAGKLRGVWAGLGGSVFLDIKGDRFSYGFWLRICDFGIGWNLEYRGSNMGRVLEMH